jgi:hypothetical protein
MAVGIPILASGCRRESTFSTDRQIAVRQVNTLIPRGASETRVKNALSARGFQLSRLNPDGEANHLLVASQTRGNITWQIGVIIVEAKVAATTVTILDASILPK